MEGTQRPKDAKKDRGPLCAFASLRLCVRSFALARLSIRCQK